MGNVFQLDYDEYGYPDLIYGSDLLDIVRMDAKRLVEWPQMGGIMIIKRTSNGYHLRAPNADLTQEQMEVAYALTYGDSGYKWWSVKHGMSTLRAQDKTIVREIRGRVVGRRKTRDVPQNIEIIKSNYPTPILVEV